MARTAALPILTAESGLSRYLEEIRPFPMLEPQDEFMLAKRWREHGDREAAHKLVTSHLRLVAKQDCCARRGRHATGPGEDHRPAARRHPNGRGRHESSPR